MPKGTHFHANHDGMSTDKKFRPEDEGIYQQEKHELQSSEISKKADPTAEESSIEDQEKNKEEE